MKKMTMYFKELLTNFIGTIEENNKNFHQVDEHLTNIFIIT